MEKIARFLQNNGYYIDIVKETQSLREKGIEKHVIFETLLELDDLIVDVNAKDTALIETIRETISSLAEKQAA